jgi:hypothetical protein
MQSEIMRPSGCELPTAISYLPIFDFATGLASAAFRPCRAPSPNGLKSRGFAGFSVAAG